MPAKNLPAVPKRGPGRPAFEITDKVLKRVEELGASGISQRWAAVALAIHPDTFAARREDNSDFSAAWNRGRAKFARQIAKDLPEVIKGLAKNAKEGNVTAQLGYIEKVGGKPNAQEEVPGLVNLEELAGGAASLGDTGPLEIQQVQFTRVRRAGKGRPEDIDP